MEKLEISESINIFDACSIINLIHIDSEDDFLLKTIKPLNPYLCEKVSEEVTANAKVKGGRIIRRDEQQAFFKKTDKKIIVVRRNFKSKRNTSISYDFGDDFIESRCREIFSYSKSNGEFYSAVLALCLSRENACRVFFYTDDMPAKREFQPTFEFQQIGTIGDTVDFLIFLYWVSPSFAKKDLANFLQALYSECSREYDGFLNTVRTYKDRLVFKPKDKFRILLSKIERELSQLKFESVSNLVAELHPFKKKHSAFVDKVVSYNKTLVSYSYKDNNYLSKILKTKKKVKNDEIFKFI